MGSNVLNSTKHLFMEDEYTCVLNNELLTMAKRDLGEDEKTRSQALYALKEWIKSQPQILRCRMDSSFLLRFLRVRKFNVAQAEDTLEKYLTARTLYPQWFNRLDVLDPGVDELISRGYAFVLPERDENGRRVLFSIGTSVVPWKTHCADTMRAMVMSLEALIDDEDTQVRGLTYVFDYKGLGLSHLAIWPPTDFHKAFTSSEKALPVRHQEIHFNNLPFIISAGFELFKTFLSAKLRKRIKVHKNSNQLVKHVPQRILPKEYGGVVPMKDMIDQWKLELVAKRDRMLALDQMAVDLKRDSAEISRSSNYEES